MTSILVFYTFLIFCILGYLLYLRIYHIGKLAGLQLEVAINFHYYLVIFYLFFFLLSLTFTLLTLMVDIGSVAIAKLLVEALVVDIDNREVPLSSNAEGGLNQGNEANPTKDLTLNTPAESNKPVDRSFASKLSQAGKAVKSSILMTGNQGNKGSIIEDYLINKSKETLVELSENNLTVRNHAICKNTIQELTGDKTVLASTLDFTKTRSVLGYTAVEQSNGEYKVYKTVDLPGLKAMYEGSAAAAGVDSNISNFDQLCIKGVFHCTSLGQPLASEIDNPDQCKEAARILDIPLKKLCISQEASSNLIEGSSDYSPPRSPTSPHNTQNPFN